MKQAFHVPGFRTALSAVVFALICALPGLTTVHAQVVYNWTAGDIVTGTITPTGTTTVASGETLNVLTAANHDISTRTVVNNGTVHWNDGAIRGGGSLTNNAQWNDSTTAAMNGAFGAFNFVNSAGATYAKLTGTTDFQVGFTNSGTIAVSGGTLNLTAGGTFNAGSTVGSTGGGVVQLTGGTLTMTGAINASNFVLNGGIVAGTHTLTGVVSWLAGTMNSIGATTVPTGSTLTISGAGNHDFDGHSIVNNGTIAWSQGSLRSGGGGIITNNAAWNDTADTYGFNNDYGGATATFVNALSGTYNKTAGNSTISVPFINYGTVVVSAGTLSLANGGTFHDGSTIGSTGAGVAQLTGGVLTAGGSAGFTANNFRLTSGQLSGNMTFLGTTNWVGSNFNTTGTATVGASGTLVIADGGNHDFNSHAIVNNGTVAWSAGALRSGGGGTLVNNAAWNDSGSSGSINNDYGGTSLTFTNAAAGTYTKSAGTTTISVPFLNYGTVTVSGGTLSLSNGGTFYDGSIIGSTGAGVAQLTGGVLTASGSTGFTGNNFKLTNGQVSGNVTFRGTTEWTGTDFNTPGTATIASGATFTIATGTNHDFNGHAFVNQGTVNWTAGHIRAGSGGTFTNNALFTESVGGALFNNDYGGAGGTTFINSATGTYSKTAGATTFSTATFVNSGTVSVSGGALYLNNATFNAGSTIGSSGSGSVQLVGGVLTANGAVNVQNFLLNGGQLTGNQTFSGTLSWLSGNLNTAGTMTIGSGATLSIANSVNHDFDGHAIVNNGTVNWTFGPLRSGSGGYISNNGVWNDSAFGVTINQDFAGGATFVNGVSGTYNKTSGSTTFSVPFTNNGLINVSGGALTAGTTFNAGGVLNVGSSGSFNATLPVTFESGSVVRGEGVVASTTINVGGDVAPGTDGTAGYLTLNGLTTFLPGASAKFDLGGTSQGVQHDFLEVGGTLTLGGNLAVKFISGFNTSVSSTMTFDLIGTTALLGSFANVPNGGTLITTDGLGSFKVNYGLTSGFAVNHVVLSNFVAVPEPSTWILLLSGLGAAAVSLRRRLRS